jgi:hypothetical protein
MAAKPAPPAVAQPKAAAKPVASKPAKPAGTQPPNANTTSWSESIRKALQEKGNQSHGPERGNDWKNQQRGGLSIAHRNKFG